MGGEEHRDAEARLDALHQLDDRLLVAGIEADEGLVEEQEPGFAEEGLGEQEALQLSARELAKRPLGEGRGSDQLDRRAHLAPPRLAEERQAPALAIASTRHEIPAAQAQIRNRPALLRQVARLGVAAPRGLAVAAELALDRADQAENGVQERGLAGTIGAENADELSGLDGEAHVGEHIAPAPRQGDAVQLDRMSPYWPARAWSRAASCESIHS